MKHRTPFFLGLVLVLLWPTYWLATTAAIRYCANDLTRLHGCSYLFWHPADETRFLKSMGKRSVAPIVRQINRPDVSLQTKVHLAWILSTVGDHTYFPVFIAALRSDSPRARYIAAFRMRDFPNQCLRSLSDILDAGMKPQHEVYWMLLSSLVDHASIDNRAKRVLRDAIPCQTNGLTQDQVVMLANMFGINSRGEPSVGR